MKMDIQELPQELLNSVLAELLWLVGPNKTLHLRVVSRVFNASIQRAICDSYLNHLEDCRGPFHSWLDRKIRKGIKISPPLMGQLVLAQLKYDRDNELFSPICAAIQVTDQYFTDKEQRQRCALQICEASADYLYWDVNHRLNLAWEIESNSIYQWKGYVNREVISSRYDISKQNILSAAIVVGCFPIVRDLLKEDLYVHVNCEHPYFGKPLQLAARWGHLEILQLLLHHGADAQAVQDSIPGMGGESFWKAYGSYYSSNGSALRVACLAGHSNIVRALMKPQYKIVSTAEFHHAIRAAGRSGHTNILHILLDSAQELVKSLPSNWINDLLLETCKDGRPEVVQMMIELGAQVDYELPEKPKYHTAIQLAAWKGHSTAIKLLLDSGVSRKFVDVPYSNGGPIELAVQGGHLDCLQLLLNCGVDIRDYAPSRYLLGIATRLCQLPMVRLLVKNGADLSSLSPGGAKLGEVLLIQAVERGRVPVIRLLIELGVSPNNPDQRVDPVLKAMINSDNDVLKTLIELGGKEIHVTDSIFAKEFSSGIFPITRKYTARRALRDFPPSWQGRDF
ncbi:hypothetical protein G7Y89_g5981 [Cudoniella acicularis]|uniref:F-box domain-containing protein n=1 Tax=Cudoniella acicularis TaxID=354080 RepID=A0A8H4W575_9HELO|nr:hypothetical protein G7Y89_g5981 [Cudoniella acicularis]